MCPASLFLSLVRVGQEPCTYPRILLLLCFECPPAAVPSSLHVRWPSGKPRGKWFSPLEAALGILPLQLGRKQGLPFEDVPAVEGVYPLVPPSETTPYTRRCTLSVLSIPLLPTCCAPPPPPPRAQKPSLTPETSVHPVCSSRSRIAIEGLMLFANDHVGGNGESRITSGTFATNQVGGLDASYSN